MALRQADTFVSNNPLEYGIVPAIECAGHKTVSNLDALYSISDAILSYSKNNTNDDAIGLEWFVIDLNRYYLLIDWDLRRTASGWRSMKDSYELSDDLTTHINNHNNPHQVTKLLVGLSNVTNDALVKRSEMGVANGVAILNSAGQVPSSLLPSYVDDIIDVYATYTQSSTGTLSDITLYSDAAKTKVITGEPGKIYQNIADGEPSYLFRWTGTVFAQTGASSLIIGEVEGTAFDGKRGKYIEEQVTDLWDRTPLLYVIANQEEYPRLLDSDGGLKLEFAYWNRTMGNYNTPSVIIPFASTTNAGIITSNWYNPLSNSISRFGLVYNSIAGVPMTFGATADKAVLNVYTNKDTNPTARQVELVAATTTKAGVMSATDKSDLETLKTTVTELQKTIENLLSMINDLYRIVRP